MERKKGRNSAHIAAAAAASQVPDDGGAPRPAPPAVHDPLWVILSGMGSLDGNEPEGEGEGEGGQFFEGGEEEEAEGMKKKKRVGGAASSRAPLGVGC